MSPRALRAWDTTHTWSSLVCTLFMLLLGATGLVLLFSPEIAHLRGTAIEAPAGVPAGTRASLDDVVAAARASHPDRVPLYVFAGEDDPNVWLVKLDTRVDSDESDARFAAVDARTARTLGTPRFDQGFMAVVYRLHVDLFGGLPGKLALGLMGALLVVSLVSGAVLYAPFMRRLRFGSIRETARPRIRSLDVHNLVGIVTVAWVGVVGMTGVVNTWADIILTAWQSEQIAALKAGRGIEVLPAVADARGGIAELALMRALHARPHMSVKTLAFPGTLLSTPEHFAVLLHGDTPLTARLTDTLLVDPRDGRVIQAAPRPWYVTALELAQPLHFGDYGGWPLRGLWALFDAATIYLLWTGLVLWIRRLREG